MITPCSEDQRWYEVCAWGLWRFFFSFSVRMQIQISLDQCGLSSPRLCLQDMSLIQIHIKCAADPGQLGSMWTFFTQIVSLRHGPDPDRHQMYCRSRSVRDQCGLSSPRLCLQGKSLILIHIRCATCCLCKLLWHSTFIWVYMYTCIHVRPKVKNKGLENWPLPNLGQ